MRALIVYAHPRDDSLCAAALKRAEAGLHGAESDLAMPIGADGDRGGFDQIEIVAIPQVGLNDTPSAKERMFGHGVHCGASARSFGKRTRL